MVGGERLRRDVVDVDGLDLGSGALTRPRSRLACRSLSLTPAAIGGLEAGMGNDDQGVVWLELGIRSFVIFIRSMTVLSPLPTMAAKCGMIGRGEHSSIA